MENLRFEDSFKEAFSGAEIAPSGVVWTNVELGLEKSSGGKLKGRILFFQLLAAASMVFAMGVGSVYFMNSKYDAAQPIAQESTAKQNNGQEAKGNQSANNNFQEDKKVASSSENTTSRKLISKSAQVETASSMNMVTEQPASEIADHEVGSTLTSRQLPRLVEIEKPGLKIPTNEPDAGMLLLAKLQDEEKKIQKNKPTLKEKLWASLGFGAGSYNPNASGTTRGSTALTSGGSISNEAIADPAAGASYSVGIGVAGKISRRIVLQGGISYLNQNSTYISNTVSGSGAFLNEYAAVKDASPHKANVTGTSPYQVSNNLQYMSIPIQAGYIIVDRDFGVQLNAGIATDVFFQNTLTPENSDYDKVTEGAGDDSPYRTLNFSGLVGTELSYKLSDHYRIALNPGVRYALNSIYKSEVAADVSPITFDVALRVRYMF